MVPAEGETVEEEHGHQGEDYQGDALLHHLELNQRVGPSIALESDAVGRDLKAVFSQGNAPREEDDKPQGPVAAHPGALQLEMAVPGQCHKHIRNDEQQYSGNPSRHDEK